MPNVILYIAQTIDGFIASSEGGVEFLDAFQDPKQDYGYRSFLSSVGVILMGSNSYELVKTFGDWEYKNNRSIVFTKQSIQADEINKIQFTNADPVDVVSKLKEGESKNIWLMGGAKLLQSFLQKKIVDKMVITTVPVVLGSGIPLFLPTKKKSHSWKLDTLKKYPNGVIQSIYSKV
jgi:dihydrofolate reductase